MKKLALWTAGGLGLATVCGIAGLAHLSATLVTLTAFYAVPGLLSIALDALPSIWKAHT